jgi:Outer membrane protein beta-barrel domain
MASHSSRILLALSGLALFSGLSAQTQFGIKVGGNFLIVSQSISPEPKDALDTPSGLGLQFGGYSNIAFSDMVGLRPELVFSFRRAKTEQTESDLTVTDQNGQNIGTAKRTTKNDQRLQYFMINAPLTISPNENLRFMVGPGIGFLMGGKVNTDVTINGTANNESFTQFSAEEKKGSAATKDFTKAEVGVVAGAGYTLEMGLDFDLRYYRAIVPTQDISESSFRYKAFTNMVELSIGYTFGS